MAKQISPFAVALQQQEPSTGTAAISLEFYEKRPRGLSVMGHDKLPWEIWVIKFTLVQSDTESERLRYRYELAPVLSDKMLMCVLMLSMDRLVD